MKVIEARRKYLVPPVGWLSPNRDHDVPGFPGYLLVVVLLAALVRLYRLDGQSLWIDEILTWHQIKPGAALAFWEQIRDAIQGPLYPAVLWPVVRWHPDPFWLRLPAAVAGILTVPLLGFGVSRLLGQRSGLLVALLLAFNPFHIWYSQEARGYAFLIFFVVVAGYLFLDMVQYGGSWSKALGLGLAGGLAMASNLSGVFFWLALGMTWLFLQARGERRELRYGLVAFGLGTLLILPWLLQATGIWAVGRLVPGAATGEALRGATTFSPLAIPYTLFTFCFGYSLGPSVAELHRLTGSQVLSGSWLPLLAAVCVVGVPLVRAWGGLRNRGWFFLVWILLPFAVLTVLALRNIKPWNPRYLAVALPWVLALLADGLVRMPGKTRGVFALLLMALTFYSLGGYFWNTRYAKEDLRAAGRFLEASNSAAEPVVVPVVTPVLAYYYRGPGTLIDSYHVPQLDGPASARQFMATRMADCHSAWIVWARDWAFDPAGYLPRELSQSGTLLQVFKAPGVKVFHWQRRNDQ